MRRKSSTTWVLALVAGMAAVSILQSETPPAARFEGKDTLLQPQGYREWVFVGSSLGLRYAQNPEEQRSDPQRGPAAELYHNVYINPASYRTFSQTGKFPEGTVMVLELASSEVKREPGLQGSYQNQFVALEAAVKDSQRFPEGWAYFSFDGPDGKPSATAKPFPKERCWSCHHNKAATDHVFTQFYPVLRAGKN